MRQYRVWQGLWLSFYSKKLYQNIDHQWRGIGVGYLLMVCGICAAIQPINTLMTTITTIGEEYAKTFALYFTVSFLVTLLYAGIAKLFVRCNHSYKALCRLATVALTPTIYLLTIVNVFALTLPYSNLVYLLLSLGYLIYAIHASHLHG